MGAGATSAGRRRRSFRGCDPCSSTARSLPVDTRPTCASRRAGRASTVLLTCWGRTPPAASAGAPDAGEPGCCRRHSQVERRSSLVRMAAAESGADPEAARSRQGGVGHTGYSHTDRAANSVRTEFRRRCRIRRPSAGNWRRRRRQANLPPARVEPLGSGRFKVQFTASTAFCEPGATEGPDGCRRCPTVTWRILEAAVTEALERREAALCEGQDAAEGAGGHGHRSLAVPPLSQRRCGESLPSGRRPLSLRRFQRPWRCSSKTDGCSFTMWCREAQRRSFT